MTLGMCLAGTTLLAMQPTQCGLHLINFFESIILCVLLNISSKLDYICLFKQCCPWNWRGFVAWMFDLKLKHGRHVSHNLDFFALPSWPWIRQSCSLKISYNSRLFAYIDKTQEIGAWSVLGFLFRGSLLEFMPDNVEAYMPLEAPLISTYLFQHIINLAIVHDCDNDVVRQSHTLDTTPLRPTNSSGTLIKHPANACPEE